MVRTAFFNNVVKYQLASLFFSINFFLKIEKIGLRAFFSSRYFLEPNATLYALYVLLEPVPFHL